jgi:type I restriction enzyme S subunit
MTLGDISLNVSSGGTPLVARKECYGGDIPWLRSREIRFIDIYDAEIKITPPAIENSSTKIIPENCFIVAISGATAARFAINKIPLATNQHCCRFYVNPKLAKYRYVFHRVGCQNEHLKALGHGTRSDLNSSIIKNYSSSINSRARIYYFNP